MQHPATKQLDKADADWWRGAVIYQIYPRSFQDDSGDGIGDLAGITRRLPYVAGLGVDAIWISPFFVSPMRDYGYDVADYCDVDPLFGSIDDFDRLIETAHTLGIRVMIDLVLSHTSDQHPWFAQSTASRDNGKHDWYVWADAKPDGNPPNNWLSIFGGSAWQWSGERCQYYLHNFLSEQPDLNLHNSDVQQALLDAAKFWLERGVDGFRLDTINFYFHDQQLRDNPALPAELRNASIAPAVNPYNHQQHIFDKNQPENLLFLNKLRALMDSYPCIAAVGEVGDDQRGMEIMGEYTAGDDLMHMCYAFDFLSATPLTADRAVHVLEHFQRAAVDGWGCWAFSNHDVQRHASRWSLGDEAKRCYATLLLCLRGSVCIYQGEELGLEEAELSFEQLQDPYGIAFWPKFKGRDGCRTPMVWTCKPGNDDFSAAKPWLPIPDGHRQAAVDIQLEDEQSLLAHYRRCIQLRQQHPALAKGSLDGLRHGNGVLQFSRTHEGKTVHCLFNLSDSEVTVATSTDNTHEIFNDSPSRSGNMITLAPWKTFIAEEQ